MNTDGRFKMGYFSDLDIDEQEHNAHIQDQEPDFMSYAHKVMASKEFEQDMIEFEQDMIDVDQDQGYDEYKETKAGLL
jgi:5-methylcytosine-specific restriction endonuclease McrBC GTP-binding regulatory subunit McrB